MKILFITNSDIGNTTYGGGKASAARFALLKQFGSVTVYPVVKQSNKASIISLLQGNYPPLRNDIIREVLDMCKKNQYDIIYADTSVCGTLIKELKKGGIKTPVLSHFQNCESDFNAIRFGRSNSPKSTIYHKLVQREEKLTLRYSDCCAALSDRDAHRLKELYGKKTDVLLPLFLKDEVLDLDIESADRKRNKYCLLFGPVLYPNVEGFRWFLKNVSPYIKIKTVIAGKGFEEYRDEFQREFVQVTGFVKDIQSLYQNAACVCIPLFHGCGMKIKTAEALMYGKTVFGTDEAFSGFQFDFDKAGGICNQAEEYIHRINFFLERGHNFYNVYSREIYQKKYSDTSAMKRYRAVFKRLCQSTEK